MSIEDLRNTAHTRDLIVSRLDTTVREAYQRASQKAWKAAAKGEEIVYSVDELSAVELVERKLLDKLHHRRHNSRTVTYVWR